MAIVVAMAIRQPFASKSGRVAGWKRAANVTVSSILTTIAHIVDKRKILNTSY